MGSRRERTVALVAGTAPDGQGDYRAALENMGYDVRIAGNGETALAILTQDPVHIVFADLAMPDMSPVGFLRAVRDIPRVTALPVIMGGQTDSLSDDDIDSLYRLGVSDIIRHPKNWTLFQRKVAALLRALNLEAELTTAHDHLLKAIDIFPGGFVIFNRDDQLVLANKTIRENLPQLRLGMSKEELWHQAAVSLGDFSPGTVEAEAWVGRQMDKLRKRPWWEIHTHDGRYLRVVTKFFDDGSQISVSLDVTEERRNEQNLQRARQEAEDANRIKAQFLAGMSHEIRTPLNAIIGFSDIIHRELMGPIDNRAYVDYATDINRSGHHLLETLTLILDISKVEAGNNIFSESEFDLGLIPARAARKFADEVDERNITLALPQDQEILVKGDEVRICRAFYCVVDNALKFGPDNSTVEIGMTLGGDGLSLWVQDQGNGMTPDEQPLAFSLFSQLDPGSGRRHSGMGMGLAYAKTIVEGHGGKVSMTSEPGRGTRVTFHLPLDCVLPSQSSSASLAS